MRVFITGIHGLVGVHLAWHLHPAHTLGGCGRNAAIPHLLPHNTAYTSCDIGQREACLRTIYDFRPDVVVHAAAMSKPNECELQRALCYQTNVQGTRHVVEACEWLNVPLVFLSTDFVFGDHGPYREHDPYDPVNYYGETKAEAEQIVLNAGDHHSIVRTVLVYAKQKEGMQPTFIQWVQNRLVQGQELRVFTDQLRTATYVMDLVLGIEAIIRQKATGIFHLCGREILSPYQMACAVARAMGYETKSIEPVTRADFEEPARRPANSTLIIEKAVEELGFNPHDFSNILPSLISL